MIAKTMCRQIGLLTVALVLLAAAGCTRESDEQGAHVIQFALWVPAAIFSVALLLEQPVSFFESTTRGWVGG